LFLPFLNKFQASASVESANNTELVERLHRQVRDLESENTELRRAIPHLKNYEGQDCTKFVFFLIIFLPKNKNI